MSLKTWSTALLLAASLAAHAEPLRLLFAGDVMLADGPGRLIAAGGDPLAPFAGLLARADYRIGNLECAVARGGAADPEKIYSFRADPAALRVLQGRFDAVSVANNHAGDFGRAAFVETLDHVAAAGLAAFGGGRNLAEAHRPLWIARKGLKIAVLGYNEFLPRRFEAGPDWPGLAWSEDDLVVDAIRAARAAGADLVIPFMHWGWEFEPRAGERQRRLARRMIDAGADAVVGGHPHVVQDVETYRGKPVIYSLGNFVFDGFDEPEGRLGWVLVLELERGGVTGWRTYAAGMDADGTPHPLPEKATPCGRGDAIADCAP